MMKERNFSEVLDKLKQEFENSEEIKELRKCGLKENVISMYRSQFELEGFFRPKIYKDIEITGKKMSHKIDIYFEFIQLNNLEKAIIKTISDRKVTNRDVWEFSMILQDLNFFPKGIIYYDDEISDEAEKIAEASNIELKKFSLFNELAKGVQNKLSMMLPDKDALGNPFWILMEEDLSERNTGNYTRIDGKVVLFLSRKQAILVGKKVNIKSSVFGLSQNQLKILIRLQEQGMFPELNIMFPEFEQPENELFTYGISNEKLKEFYLRGENDE
ncbi:MAG: hypothetical protein FWH31_01885 [Streptococcaceae bacterium]|nr:hypothetical protein [Streptococcaceae bacterium]